MGQEPTPSSGSTRGRRRSAPAAAAVTEGKKDATSVDLIGFAPTLAEVGQVSSGKNAAAALARRAIVRWGFALAVLFLFGLVLLLGPKLYRGYKNWRATQFALQGEELLRENQVQESIPPIRSAYTLSPKTPEVLRAMAQILTAFSSPEATNYWKWLLQTSAANDDDRRAAIDCAMRYGLYDEASTLIKDLLARNGGDSRNQLLAARWYAQRGTPAQTMAYATRAVNDDPTNQAAVLFLAARELPNQYLHQEAVNSLLRIAGSDDAFGLQALRQVALDPNLKPAEIDRVIARLHSHPLSEESERVAALVLEIKRHPEQRESLIDRAVAAHQNVTPDDLATFCEWLDTNNEAPRVLKLIPREKALSDKDLCFAYLDGLAALKRWDDIKNLLSGTTVPLEVPLVELYLSRCANEMGDDEGSESHWQNAVAAAAYDPVESLRLALYAENHGQNERAAALYRALTQEPVTARIAYVGLLRVLSDKDSRTRRDLLDQVVTRWPEDPELASQDIQLNLLLNERVPEMHRRAVSLLADDSDNLSLRTNVALACLRLNDPAGALQAYHQAVIDWNTAPVTDLVIYAAVLNANGNGKAAHQFLASVNRHALRPEFRELIKSIP